MIYITGDTHGYPHYFLNGFMDDEEWTEDDILIVCGDFGYIFLNDLNEDSFLNYLSSKPYTICFADGNHENFPAIFSYPEEIWNGGRIHRIRKNIIHLMRGQVFTLEGSKFFVMGGGFSIDWYYRTAGYSYWSEELPSEAEYEEARKNLAANGNKVDYIITHTAPSKAVRYMNIFWHMHFETQNDEKPFNEFLQHEVMDKVSYKHWYFGHFHLDREIAVYNMTAVLDGVHKIEREEV